MSHSEMAATEALNEAMRKPLSPGFGLGRMLFALVTYQMVAGSVNDTVFGLWATLWCVSFAKDAFTGIAPFQTIWSAAFGTVCWLSWIALFFT
jgi:hypothetical protein